jgi:hypothetical protein
MSFTARIQETLNSSRSDDRMLREIASLRGVVEDQGLLLRDLHARVTHLTDELLRREFDSLASSQAEAMVYITRSLRNLADRTGDPHGATPNGGESAAS